MSVMTLILVAVLGFIIVASLGFVFAGGDGSAQRTARRTQAIAERGRTDKPRANLRNVKEEPGQRRKQILKSLKEQDKQQRKASMTLSARLQQAGMGASTRMFWIVSAVLGTLALPVPALLGFNPLFGLGTAFAAGLGLPRWVIGVMAKKRTGKFSAAFADAIDIIVRGIKSGLPVHDCLKIIARESPEPLASEFNRLVESIGMGVTVEQALEKMYERMPTPELRFFTIVLAIQQKAGGNLAEALNGLSVVLRARKMMREKVKALSAEAIASSMIIGSLPPGVALLITITTPSYMALLITDKRGHMLLLIASFLMAFGIWVMRKMINFKM